VTPIQKIIFSAGIVVLLVAGVVLLGPLKTIELATIGVFGPMTFLLVVGLAVCLIVVLVLFVVGLRGKSERTAIPDRVNCLSEHLNQVSKEKEQLVQEIQVLPNEDLNNYQVFLNYIQRSIGPQRRYCCGDLIRFASEELRANRKLVLEAVKYPNECVADTLLEPEGSPLEYASEDLRNDREVVLWAIWHSADAFEFASAELTADQVVYFTVLTKAITLGKHEVDPQFSNRFYKDTENFYNFLNSLYSGEFIQRPLEEPEGFEYAEDIGIVDQAADIWQELVSFESERLFLDNFKDEIINLFSDRALLLRALDETKWAKDYIPIDASAKQE
jgi:hypothetical protein